MTPVGRNDASRNVSRRGLLRAGAGSLALSATAGRVSAQSGEFSPLGSVHIEGTREVVTSHDGRTAYVAATDGFAIVDVSDPANPIVLATHRDLLSDRPNGPLDGIHDVKVDGDRLLVVGPAGTSYDSIEAAVVFDVRDPSAPRQVSVHEVSTPIHNGFLEDGVAFLCLIDGAENPLVTVDAETGTELGRWSLPAHDPRWADVPAGVRPIHDVTVHRGLAYVSLWDAGTWVVDVRDPADPSVVTSVGGRPPEALLPGEIDTGTAYTEPPGNDHYSTVNDEGTLLGIGKESWDDPSTEGGGPSGIALWDVSTIDSPRRLAVIPPPPTPDPTREGVWVHAHNFEFVGDYLYTSWFRGGVKVYDVSDPANPTEVAAWRDSSGGGLFTSTRVSFWAARMAVPGSFFVASAWEDYDDNADPRLFTFPDPATHADPATQGTPGSPSAADPSNPPDGSEGDSPPDSGSGSGATDTTSTSGASPSPSVSPSSGPSSGVSAVGGPGFGVLATACALGIAAWRLLRRE